MRVWKSKTSASFVAILGVLFLVLQLGGAGPASAFSDTAPPVLVSSSVTPTSVDISSTAGTVTVSAHITDATGTSTPTAEMRNVGTTQTLGFGSLSLTSGTAQDGTWGTTINVPVGSAPGQWDVQLYPLSDTLGNSTNAFQTLQTVTVTGPPSDSAPPVLVSSSVTPTSVDISSTAGTVTVSAHITDATGTSTPTAEMRNVGTTQTLGFGSLSLTSGTAQDGTWGTTINVPVGSAPGQWDVQLYPLSDTLGDSTNAFQTLQTVTVTGTRLQVSPAAVVFTDKDGTKDDTYTVPATTGVDYLLGGTIVPAGTYPGTGTVTITAQAQTDYVLAAGATASWTATFSTAVPDYAPPAVSPFIDVSTGQPFYKEMAWMSAKGISTGWAEAGGARSYRPLQSISRDAMAAFMYRMAPLL